MKRFVKLAALAAALLSPVAARAQDSKPSSNAPQDRPVDLATREAMDRADRAMQPYVDSARATWPAAKARYLAGLPPKQQFFTVTRLHDALGHEEQVFVAVDRIENGRIYGHIQSDIDLVRGYRFGQAYDFPESELVDWLIAHPDGTEEGNVVGKFMDSYKP